MNTSSNQHTLNAQGARKMQGSQLRCTRSLGGDQKREFRLNPFKALAAPSPINYGRITVHVTRRERGVGLIEVLIALLVTSIGLLGLASLQIQSLKQNQSAALMAQANVLAYDMLDRLRANPNRAENGDYNLSLAAATPTGSAIQDVDLTQWRDMLGDTLPEGTGSVECTSAKLCTVLVQWNTPSNFTFGKQTSAPSAAGGLQTIQLVSQL